METIDEKLYKACVAYLKSHETHRLLLGMRKKVISYGEVRGTVVLKSPTEQERLFLRGLFKRAFDASSQVSVGLLAFEKAINETVFKGVTLVPLLEAYLGEPIIDQKSAMAQSMLEKTLLLEDVRADLIDEPFKAWLEGAFFDATHMAYRLIAQWLSNRNAVDVKLICKQFDVLLRILEAHVEGIGFPVAAALATGNPHALDRKSPLRNLLMLYIRSVGGLDAPSSPAAYDALFESFNLLTDEVPRTVLVYGLEAYGALGNAFGWEGFFHRKEPLYLSKLNLKQVHSIQAVTRRIRCFENPSAFHRFIKSSPDQAAVCTSGQLHALDYDVLDHLFASGHLMAYSGDFDPEGLGIADRLKKRYPKIDLSHFSIARYHASLSQEQISPKRLKQLEKITDEGLNELAKEIAKHKVAGYEELLGVGSFNTSVTVR